MFPVSHSPQDTHIETNCWDEAAQWKSRSGCTPSSLINLSARGMRTAGAGYLWAQTKSYKIIHHQLKLTEVWTHAALLRAQCTQCRTCQATSRNCLQNQTRIVTLPCTSLLLYCFGSHYVALSMPWHFCWAFLPRHSKKLPAWATSVRPKFNRPERTEAMPALPGVTDATASRKIRVLVLHSNRQNAQDFKTLGHAQTATFEIERDYWQRKMFFVEAVTNGFVLYTQRSSTRLSFYECWLMVKKSSVSQPNVLFLFSFFFDLIEPATRFTIGSLKEKNSLGVASADWSLFAKVITNLVLGISISLIQTYTVSDTYVCLMSLVFLFSKWMQWSQTQRISHIFYGFVFVPLFFGCVCLNPCPQLLYANKLDGAARVRSQGGCWPAFCGSPACIHAHGRGQREWWARRAQNMRRNAKTVRTA